MKRIFVLLVALLLCAVLTGCGAPKSVRIVDVAAGDFLAAVVFSDGSAALSGKCLAEVGVEKLPNFSGTVAKWKNVVDIAVGDNHVIALLKNGTVVAAGSNRQGQCNVESWRDVVSVEAGDTVSVGITKDGTVLTAGKVSRIAIVGGKITSDEVEQDMSGITEAAKARASLIGTVVLHKDGHCTTVGISPDGAFDGVDRWENMKDVDCNGSHTIGVKNDGTVIAVGANADGRCNVSGWTDVVQVACGAHSVALKADGTVVAKGGKSAACNVGDWTDIVFITASTNDTLGLRSDGTIVACGLNVEKWDIALWNARVTQ